MKPIVVFTASLSTFFILFSSEGRKCDFFVRHNVGNSPRFLTNLPFHDFPKYFNHD